MLVATGNTGKLAEFRALLRGFEVQSPADVDLANLQVDESGSTFAANAHLKAQAFVAASGKITIADDSGLEIDALDGAPGILSARYGGAGLDDEDRCNLVLQRLLGVAPTGRMARFRCCLIVLAPDGREATAEGVCEGNILTAAAGSGGFGYDPIFLTREYGRSMAALTPAEKAAISHRGKALRALLPRLSATFPELTGG